MWKRGWLLLLAVAGLEGCGPDAAVEDGLSDDGALAAADVAGLVRPGLRYFPLSQPVRLVNTLLGTASLDPRKAPLAAGETLTVAGQVAEVSTQAQVLVGNVTAVTPSARGRLALFAGPLQPATSTLNYELGQTTRVSFHATLAADGTFRVATTAATDLVVDVVGFFAPSAEAGLFFHSLPQPVRLLDTRVGAAGLVKPGKPLEPEVPLRVPTSAVVPSTAQVLVGTATAVQAAGGAGGLVTLFATGAARPEISTLSSSPGQAMASAVHVPLGTEGFDAVSSARVDLIVDVVGYFSNEAVDVNGTGLLYSPLETPVRLLDTRASATTFYRPKAPLAANVVQTRPGRNLMLGGQVVPTGARAIVGSAIAVAPAAGGVLAIVPDAATFPGTSSLNFAAGVTRANAFTARLSSGGAFSFKSSAQTDLVIDLFGFYRAPTDATCLSVSTAQELVIRNLKVVEDPVRTRGAGRWTFNHLITELAGTQDKTAFVKRWLLTFDAAQTVNTFSLPRRAGVRSAVLTPWETKSGGASRPLDFNVAPFRLLAIVNRLDLRKGEPITDAGEGRFVFGVLDGRGNPLQFTVIFEYKLPAASRADVLAWAERWHRLGALPTGGAEFNAALEDITRRFASRGLRVGTFNGSSLGQIRTNDIVGGGVWQMREFHLTAAGRLAPATNNQSPRDQFSGSATLANFVNQNEAAILTESHVVPRSFAGAPFQGGLSNETFTWNAPGITNPQARHLFALNTCNGCHLSETGTSFLHVFPRSAGQISALSGFVTGTTVADPVAPGLSHTFGDLGRRRVDLETLLCQPEAAAPLSGNLAASRVH